MKIFEITQPQVLYHATDMAPAYNILKTGKFLSSWDDIDHDNNIEAFLSTTTNPDLWFSGGVKNSANVTFVLQNFQDYKLQSVNRWDEIRIVLGERPDDSIIPQEGSELHFPANKNTIKEIWVRNEGGLDGDDQYLDRFLQAAKSANIKVIEKESNFD